MFIATATAAMLAAGHTAHASSIVYTTSGTNSVAGQAGFEFFSDHVTITLQNLTGTISLTAQELDGLSFQLAGGGAPTLQTVVDAGIIDCSGDHSYPCASYGGVVPANDGWAATTSSGMTLLAPTSGYHPYAIINTSYALPGQGNGNLANPQHNPFLLGPVTFTLAGTFTSVSNVSFYWGTEPYITQGVCSGDTCGGGGRDPLVPAPEPASLVLLGTGLLAIGSRARRRRPRPE